MSNDDAFEEWLDRNWEILGGLLVCLGEKKMRTMFVKFNATVIATIVARVGIELAGSSLAYAIDGKAGMDAWVEYSNAVFADTTWFPNPIAVADSIWESEQMITEEFDVIKDIKRVPALMWLTTKTLMSAAWNFSTSRKYQLQMARGAYEN